MAGRNFAEAIASGRRLGFQQVHALGRIAAQVLALLHEKGLVHGSVRPSNVMVATGVIKIADLGLGRLAAAAPAAASYHAPEGGLTPADDLYALAGVIYHLLTGDAPALAAAGGRAAAAVAARAGRARGHGQAAAARACTRGRSCGSRAPRTSCASCARWSDRDRMSFAGDLHTFDIFDLLGWLTGRKKAGVLQMTRRSTRSSSPSATAPCSGRARTTRARRSARRWCATG